MSDRAIRWVLKPAAFAAGLVPFAWLIRAALIGTLSANPLEDITHETGIWALRLLCVTLTITPLRRLTGWHAIVRFRRMAGLFAFFYAVLHLLIYTVADRYFAALAVLDLQMGAFTRPLVRELFRSIGEDIYKRPYITVGFTAFVLMLPLALTSTAGMIRRLGKRWTQLHRLVYVSATLGVVHYWWLVKADIRRPLAYALVVGSLLGFRLAWARRRLLRPSAVGPRQDAPRGAHS